MYANGVKTVCVSSTEMLRRRLVIFAVLFIQSINTETSYHEFDTQSVLLNYAKLMNTLRKNFDDDIKKFEQDVLHIITEADKTIRLQVSDLVNHLKKHKNNIEEKHCISNTLKTVEVLSVHRSLKLCEDRRNELLIEDKIEKLEHAGIVLDDAFLACNTQNKTYSESASSDCVKNAAKETTTKLHELKKEIEASLKVIRDDISECVSRVVIATKQSLDVAAEYFESCANIANRHVEN